jgi:hypothetical protein
VAPHHRVEFVIDEAPDVILPKTRPIGDFDLCGHCLGALVTEDVGPRAPSVASLGSALLAARDEKSVPFAFVVADTERKRFKLAFRPTQTVREVKSAVLSELHRPEDTTIDLLFAGKALRNDFILERLRIGRGEIVVSLKAATTLALVTWVRPEMLSGLSRLVDSHKE